MFWLSLLSIGCVGPTGAPTISVPTDSGDAFAPVDEGALRGARFEARQVTRRVGFGGPEGFRVDHLDGGDSTLVFPSPLGELVYEGSWNNPHFATELDLAASSLFSGAAGSVVAAYADGVFQDDGSVLFDWRLEMNMDTACLPEIYGEAATPESACRSAGVTCGPCSTGAGQYCYEVRTEGIAKPTGALKTYVDPQIVCTP